MIVNPEGYLADASSHIRSNCIAMRRLFGLWLGVLIFFFLFLFFGASLKSSNVHSSFVLNNHHPFDHVQLQQHINHGRLRKEAHCGG